VILYDAQEEILWVRDAPSGTTEQPTKQLAMAPHSVQVRGRRSNSGLTQGRTCAGGSNEESMVEARGVHIRHYEMRRKVLEDEEESAVFR